VVDEHRHRGIGGDVAEPLEVGRAFGLGIHREVDGVAVDRECDWHDVRFAIRADGREMGGTRFIEVASQVRSVHRTKYR